MCRNYKQIKHALRVEAASIHKAIGSNSKAMT